MPDGRFLSKAIANDWELNQRVSLEADYLFARCIPHLDREGRMPGSPEEVKGIAVPLRPELSIAVVERCLEELAEADLVEWYSVDGRPVLQFPGFDRHQKGLRKEREAESRLPSPQVHSAQKITASLRSYSGPTPEHSGSTPDLLPPKFKFKFKSKSKSKKNPSSTTSPVVETKTAPETERRDGLEENAEPTATATTETDERTDALWSEIAKKAHLKLGLGKLSYRDEARNRDILTTWRYKKNRDPWSVLAAIEGACLLRREGGTWLEDGTSYTLAALVKAEVVADQGDGTALRPLFAVAEDRWRKHEAGKGVRRSRDGPTPIADILGLDGAA
jgi:hypothetical protein